MASAGGIRAGRAFVELGVRDRLQKGLKAAQAKLRAFSASVGSIGTAMVGASAAILAPLGAAVKHFASFGDTLNKMSARTGVSVESLSELGFAAEQSGSDLATVEKGVRTMQRSVNDLGRGLSTQTDAFSELGLSIGDLEGLNPEAQFKLIADRLSKIEDPGKRAALAMMIFGRAGTQLLPLMAGGAAGMESLQEEARRLGLTVSTDTAANAAKLTDTMNILWRVLKNGVFTIGAALAPTLISLIENVVGVSVAVVNWIKENGALIATVAKVAALVGAAGVVLLGLAGGASILAAGLGGIASLLTLAGSLLATILSPIGIVTAAIVGLGVYLLFYTDAGGAALQWLSDQFGKLMEFAAPVIQGIKDALAAGDLQLAAEIAWKGLELAWKLGVLKLTEIWLGFKNATLKMFDELWTGVLVMTAGAVKKYKGLLQGFVDALGSHALSGAFAAIGVGVDAIAAGEGIGDVGERDEARRRKSDAAIAALEDEIADLQHSLEKDFAEAHQKRLENEFNRKQRGEEDAPPPPPELPALDGVADMIEKATSVGTFSAAAAGLFGLGVNPLERTAEAAEETAANTKAIKQALAAAAAATVQ